MSRKVLPILNSPKKQKTEEFKRPNHPDFMDASELKKIKFSGLRCNQIGLQTEIWILGNIEATIPFTEPLSNLEKKYKEIFGFHMDSEIIVPYKERHRK